MNTSSPLTSRWITAFLVLVIGAGWNTEGRARTGPAPKTQAAPPGKGKGQAPARLSRARGPLPAVLSWEERELGRLEAELFRQGGSPRGAEPVLGIGALAPRLPEGVLSAFLRKVQARRLHPLVRDALGWLALGAALDRGDDREASRLREALGLITDSWWMLGPFDNEGGAGMRRRLGPELAPGAPLPLGKTYTGKSSAVAWRRLPPLYPDGLLGPGELLESPESTVILLRTDVVALRPQVAALRLGTTGPYRLYCNGKLVAERDVRRPLRPDQDAVGVSLVKGPNAVLLVLASEGGAPQAVMRVTAASGGPLPGWVSQAPGRTALGAPPRPHAAKRASFWPAEPPRGASGDGVTVISGRPKPTTGPRVESVRQSLEEHARRRPKDAAAHAALARYHLATSPDDPREERALASARTALSLGPSPAGHLLVAHAQGQADAQRRALEAALGLDPRYAPALHELAEHYYGAGRHPRAEALFSEALTVDPGQIVAALRLAELAAVRRMPSLARSRLLALAARYPKRPDVLESLANVEQDLGLTEQSQKRTEALYRTQRRTVSIGQRLLGLARQRLDHQASERILREMIRTRPDWMWAREELAAALAANGSPEAGLRVLKEAIALAPRTHRLQLALVRVALRAGLVSIARKALGAALEIRPQDLAAKRLASYLERRGPDPLVARWAVDAAALARQARGRTPSREDAEVLSRTIAFDVLPSGLSRRFEQQVVLIQSRKAVEAWHTHQLDYLPDTQHLEVRVARVIRPDGSEEEATRSDVSLGHPAARLYYDRRLMVIQFRALRPGDVLEIQTVLSDIPAGNLFKDYFGAILALQARAPTAHLRVAVALPPGRTLHANRPTGLGHRVTRGAKGTLHLWEARGVRAAEPEPLGPGWAEEQSYLHLSTFGSWPEVARWYWGLVKEQFHADDAMRLAAKEATRAARTLRDKVLAIYHLVVTRTRYVALAFGMHTYKPYSAPQVFARKFGDCKDKAMLMAVLLRELGIESFPALVRTRPGGQLADEPPSLAVFDHAILYVPALDLWLDGTAERTGSGELPWADQGVSALIIDGKDGRRVRTPVLPASSNLTRRNLVISLAADGSAEVADRLVITGQEAPWWRRTLTDPDTRRRQFERIVSGVFPRAKVSSVEASDPDALEQPVTVEARYRVPGFARVSGGRVTVDLTLAESPLTPQLAPLSTRTQPVVYRFPFSQKVTVTVRWPKGWRLGKAPESATVRELPASGSFALEASQRAVAGPEQIVLTRQLDMRRHRFEPAEYPALRRFWVHLDKARTSPLELTRPRGAP